MQKQRFSLAYFNTIEKCILEGDRIQKSELKIPFGQHLQSKVEEKEGGNESIKEIGDIFLLGWLQLILCVTEVLVQKSRGTPTTRRRENNYERNVLYRKKQKKSQRHHHFYDGLLQDHLPRQQQYEAHLLEMQPI